MCLDSIIKEEEKCNFSLNKKLETVSTTFVLKPFENHMMISFFNVIEVASLVEI